MSYLIDNMDSSEYQEVVDVWEASVRATHHFLQEGDIEYFKPLILNEYLKAVDLRCIRNKDGGIIAFLGVAGENIEMLFVHPDVFGKGVGQALLNYAIEDMSATKVDVNEDNPQAVGFYQHFGFVIVSRSELDPLGKPYPILHLELQKQT